MGTFFLRLIHPPVGLRKQESSAVGRLPHRAPSARRATHDYIHVLAQFREFRRRHRSVRLAVLPVPMPIIALPGASRFRVAKLLAVTGAIRESGLVTLVPSLIFSVLAAQSARH